MKIKVLTLLLLVSIKYNINGLDKTLLNPEQPLLYYSEKPLDKKARLIPNRMTDEEKHRLAIYIKQKLYNAQQQNNFTVINTYERLTALLEKLSSEKLSPTSVQDEKRYTEYFNLIIDELKSLNVDPQVILQTSSLRQKLLEGKLEKKLWFVKEIEALVWLFENDSKQATRNKKIKNKGLQSLSRTQLQWPHTQDKALYVVSLVDQIERNYQRVETEDLATIIETCERYLISFLPDIPAILQRIAQEALNKLNKIRNIRDIPLLKE